MGMGWSVNASSSISRCRQTKETDNKNYPVMLTPDDRFCLGGQKLIAVSGKYGANNTHYRTEIDSLVRVISKGAMGSGPAYFTVERTDGSISFFGKTNDSVVQNSNGTILNWSLNQVQDNMGNKIDFVYNNRDFGQNELLIERIEYSGHTVTFNYNANTAIGNRKDVSYGYMYGAMVEQTARLDSIDVNYYEGASQVYTFDYQAELGTEITQLISIKHCAGSVCLPETVFDWVPPSTDKSYSQIHYHNLNNGRESLVGSIPADVDGDGVTDLVYVTTSDAKAYQIKLKYNKRPLSNYFGKEELLHTFFTNNAREPAEFKAADVDGDGQTELVFKNRDVWQYYDFNAFSALTVVNLAGLNSENVKKASELYFFDVDGDAVSDIIFADTLGKSGGEMNVLYNQGLDSIGRATWTAPKSVSLVGMPKRNLSLRASENSGFQENLKISPVAGAYDFNGDGVADLLFTSTDKYTTYEDEECDDVYGNGDYYCRSSTRSSYTNYLVPFVFMNGKYEMFGSPISLGDRTNFRGANNLYAIADINGDGYSDILSNGARWNIRYGDGFHFTKAVPLSIDDEEPIYINEPKIADFNGDSKPDIAYFKRSDKTWYVIYQQKGGFSDKNRLVGPLIDYSVHNDTTFIAEWEGDGTADFTYIDSSANTIRMYADRSNEGSRVNQVETITSGFGLQTEIEYKRLIDPRVYVKGEDAQRLKYGKGSPIYDLISSTHVVSKVTSDAPSAEDAQGTLSVEYAYEGLRAQAGGRGSLGFKILRTYDQVTNVTTETVYNQEFPFIGMPLETRRYLGKYLEWDGLPDNQKLSAATNKYGSHKLNAQKTIYPYLEQSTETQYSLSDDGTSTFPLSTVITDNFYVGYGIYSDSHVVLKRVKVTTFDGSDREMGSTLTTNRYFAENIYRWWLGRVTETSVTHARADAFSSTQAYVDPTRYSRFTYYSSGIHAGMLRTETIEPSGTDEQTLTTLHCYDGYGNKSGTVTYSKHYSPSNCSAAPPANVSAHKDYVYRQSNVQYDGQGRHVLSQSNGLFTSNTVIDRNEYGQVIESRDINNVTQYQAYDSFGRPYASMNSTGAYGTVYRRLSYHATADTPHISEPYYFVERTQAAGKPSQYAYFDKLGRQVAAVKQGFSSGEWIYQYSRYDAYGRVTEQSVASKSLNPTHWSRTQYDVFGRAQTVTTADGTLSSIDYNGLSMTTSVTFDAHYQGQVTQTTEEVKDVFGQVTSVTDNLQGQTQYFYDITGNLTKVIGVDGVAVTTEFDKLGRKISMQDPNKGHWRYTYNALGELTSQTSQVGHTSTFYRDALGRTVKRHVSGLSVNETTRYEFTQHQLKAECLTSGNNLCGNASVKKDYNYDAFGRISALHTTLDSRTYTQVTTYDHLGRVFQQFDGVMQGDIKGLHFVYNDQGYVYQHLEASQSGGSHATVYKHIISMDAFGNITEYRQNNNRVTTERQFDPITGYATDIKVNNGITDIQVNRYRFDAIGNLRSRTNDSLHQYAAYQAESFRYDGLNRLTHINYVERVRYDNNGNIKWKSDVNNGNASYYCYRSERPHAVSGLGRQGCTTQQYRYDGNGNMTSGKGRTIRYAHFDKPTYIHNAQGTTTFAYDTSRRRYKRETTEGSIKTTTYYVGNVEHVYKNGVYSEVRRYLPDAIQTQYVATGATRIRYLHKDHLGSINTITNADGKIVEKLHFDAWGKKGLIHKSNWLQTVQSQAAYSLVSVLNITPRGFTGHEHVDHADIIHMNGRIYDPTLGRFLQADPFIQAPKNSQSYNRYSYVLNNPLSYTDPSGYFFSKLWKGIKKFAGVIAGIVVAVYCPACTATFWSSVFTGAAIGAGSAALNGGNILRGALVGAFSGAAFFKIGQHFKSLSRDNLLAAKHGVGEGAFDFGGLALTRGQIAGQIASHAVAGGIASELQGGKFGHGFFSAGVTKGFGGAFLSGGANAGTSAEMAQNTVISAVIGGTASVVSGGKFVNGARTAAFQYLFNAIGDKVKRHIAVKQAINNLKSTYRSALRLGSAEIGAGKVRIGTYVYEHDSWFSDEVTYSADRRVNPNGGRFISLGSNVGAGAQGSPSGVSDWVLTVDESMGPPDLIRLEALLGEQFDVKSVYMWNTSSNSIQHFTRSNGESNAWSCSNYQAGGEC
jgi:RHS repeat-associated protein